MSDDDEGEGDEDQREEAQIAQPKAGQWVRILREHSDGIDKLLGKVKAVYKYGGHLRYAIEVPGGNKMDIDARSIKRLDIVTELSLLDDDFVAALEGRSGYDDQGGDAGDKTAPNQPTLPDLPENGELPSWKPAPTDPKKL